MSEIVKLIREDVYEIVRKAHPEFTKGGIYAVGGAVFDALGEALSSGNQVEIRKVGVFYVKKLPPRKSTHPKTGEPVNAPAFRGVKFKMSSEIKENLAKLEDSTNG